MYWDFISQKTEFFIITALKSSDLTNWCVYVTDYNMEGINFGRKLEGSNPSGNNYV
jgi:hypothetical protein